MLIMNGKKVYYTDAQGNRYPAEVVHDWGNGRVNLAYTKEGVTLLDSDVGPKPAGAVTESRRFWEGENEDE